MTPIKIDFVYKGEKEANSVVASHRHQCHEIVCYGRGCRGETVIAGNQYPFRSGSVAVIPKSVPHSERHFAAGQLIFFGFKSSECPQAGMYDNQFALESIAECLAAEVQNQLPQYEALLSLKIQELCIYLQRNAVSSTDAVKSLEYCKNYIEENYMQDIRVRDLAKMTGYSSDYFRHLFAERFSVSPQCYLVRTRTEKARELLRSTAFSCIRIAHLCGFSDSGQMAKIIRRAYGLSPTALRKRERA